MHRLIKRGQRILPEDLMEGGLILVDKPLGWTSFDVVNKLRFTIRHLLGVKKYKVGHAGTLDPLATGLLLICCAKHTKTIPSLTGLDKSYTGTMHMWAETPSYDAEFQPSIYHPQVRFAEEQLTESCTALTGSYMQAPPQFSAIKKKGVPLYRSARRGVKVEVPKRPVIIHRFEISRVDWPFIDFEVDCSKGTYIRSLVSDFGKSLNNGAYLSALRRTAVGSFVLSEAWKMTDLINHIKHAAQ